MIVVFNILLNHHSSPPSAHAPKVSRDHVLFVVKGDKWFDAMPVPSGFPLFIDVASRDNIGDNRTLSPFCVVFV
jgi:hypothetical protein